MENVRLFLCPHIPMESILKRTEVLSKELRRHVQHDTVQMIPVMQPYKFPVCQNMNKSYMIRFPRHPDLSRERRIGVRWRDTGEPMASARNVYRTLSRGTVLASGHVHEQHDQRYQVPEAQQHRQEKPEQIPGGRYRDG